MKKNAFMVVAVALGLSGCASMMSDGKTPDPGNPLVSVVSGRYIVVNQEPIVVPRGSKDFRITWELPRSSSYTFPEDGIVISGGSDEFKCNLEAGRTRFTCVDRNSRPGRYKYTIKVMDGANALPALDPIIVNDT